MRKRKDLHNQSVEGPNPISLPDLDPTTNPLLCDQVKNQLTDRLKKNPLPK
jgi:hypothetical protein